MNYCKNYCEEKEISTSELNEAQKTMYYIAENMKMDKSISEEGYKHFQIAIAALEQEPYENVSPVTPKPKYEDIAKAFQLGLAFGFGEKYDEMDKVIDEIKNVITPQPRKGHWIEHPHEWGDNWQYSDYECSICHNWSHFDTDYCPNCGANMIEPRSESEDEE